VGPGQEGTLTILLVVLTSRFGGVITEYNMIKQRGGARLFLAGARVRDVEPVPVARPTRELVERRETRAVGGATVKVG
jgi:hypothetical protein